MDPPSVDDEDSFHLCQTCQRYLEPTLPLQHSQNGMSSLSASDTTVSLCHVCFGLFDTTWLQQHIIQTMQQASQPYGGMKQNVFAIRHGPTIFISGHVYWRYYCYQQKQKQKQHGTSEPFSKYIQHLKHHIHTIVDTIVASSNDAFYHARKADTDQPLPSIVTKEEQGFLGIHLMFLPPKHISSPIPLSNHQPRKRSRKRYKGPIATMTQGGDPRSNLQLSLELNGYDCTSLTTMESALQQQRQGPQNNPVNHVSSTTNQSKDRMECHVAVFRRPMCFHGYYTKHRRDVSQTPFIVVENHRHQHPTTTTPTDKIPSDETSTMTTMTTTTVNSDTMTKLKKTTTTTLGISSVQQEICQPLEDSLGGISTQNNHPTSADIHYGGCKFHASGREDMNVRMILGGHTNTSGRPFCIQVIDSYGGFLPSHELHHVVAKINHTDHNNDKDNGKIKNDNDGNRDTQDHTGKKQWYGNNPNGVGIDPTRFDYCSLQALGRLQLETESKVKWYGCYCWCEDELSKDWATTTILNDSSLYPIVLSQKTPLRVLHRRSNLIRQRHILSGYATRIDDHHFHLTLRTQAGTYVKEFVHGDLRRTCPSVSSLLGCKTDLLELDCEGIDLGGDDDIWNKSDEIGQQVDPIDMSND